MHTPQREVVELLGRIQLFSELGEAELVQVAAIAMRRRHPAHKVIVRQGEVNGDMSYVIKGLLKVTAGDSSGKEIVLNLLSPGDSFGEIAFLDGGPRSATVSTLEPSELLEIRRGDFFRMLQRFPTITSNLMMVMAQRIRDLTERAENTAFLDVRARLAKWLGELADNHGTPLGPRQVALNVRLSQQELGDMVQATRESVNKCLREWIKDGIIQQNGRQLIIEDRQRLRDLSTGEPTFSRDETAFAVTARRLAASLEDDAPRTKVRFHFDDAVPEHERQQLLERFRQEVAREVERGRSSSAGSVGRVQGTRS